MDHLECLRLLDGELFVDKHISVKPNRFHYDDGGVNGPQNQLENVRVTNDRYVSPPRQLLLNWYVITTGVANESSSSSPSPIKNSSSKRPCTDANNILNASEDGELSTDSSSNVLQTKSTRSASQINAPRSSVTHVDAYKQHSVEANNNPVTPTENTLNQATNSNNNQIDLASSAHAIPSIVPIGEHVVEWVSLRRDAHSALLVVKRRLRLRHPSTSLH
jgi:hypothetical protein